MKQEDFFGLEARMAKETSAQMTPHNAHWLETTVAEVNRLVWREGEGDPRVLLHPDGVKAKGHRTPEGCGPHFLKEKCPGTF